MMTDIDIFGNDTHALLEAVRRTLMHLPCGERMLRSTTLATIADGLKALGNATRERGASFLQSPAGCTRRSRSPPCTTS